MNVAGIVLCGGASRRMGRDKVWLEVFGEPLLVRVVEVVRRVLSPVVVVAGKEQTLPTLDESVLLVHDALAFAGPVVGLETGVQAVESAHLRPNSVFVTGVDAPLLSEVLIDWMLRHCAPGRGLATQVNGQVQPLPAIYPFAELVASLRESAMLDRRSLQSLIAALPFDIISADDMPSPSAFRPANTPAEFAELVASAAQREVRSTDPADRDPGA